MNLALHGFLLQVLLSILNFKDGFKLCSAGEPGYLDFDNLPETNFSCQGKVIGGYYADVEAGCQMFHVCTIGQKDEIMDIKFLCLNGTVFDQETRVCERVDEVDCSKSERFYNLNLELYGNNAVTLSLHEEEDDDSTESRDEQHQQQHHHMTSAHPSTTTTTTTTTPRPTSPPTTSTSVYSQQQPTGYPQHYQPRPAFLPVQTSQSNTRYDDKNGGYHHQYIFHNDERSNNNQATSYQLFSNQGPSSTTPTPQNHQQVRYATTNPTGVHGETSTTMPLQYHVQPTPPPIQTLLNNNGNGPSLINPLFHNHGIVSTTEHFNVHNTNPREIAEYEDDSEEEPEDENDETGPPDSLQSTNKGKVSKLPISSAPRQEDRPSLIQTKNNQSSQHPKISLNYLPTSNPSHTTVRAFYPTQRPPALQKPQKFQLKNQMNQHTHVPPSSQISQEKTHQITINLPPSDVHRIVQNPSPLLPSQSRVIVTAKASVSDESGRPLNASQLITLPLATLSSNYDDYKEGEESFDPFYRDVPKIRNDQRIIVSRRIETSGLRSRRKRSAEAISDRNDSSGEVIFNAEIKDIKDLKANLPIIKAILFGLPIPENEESLLDPGSVDFEDPQSYEPIEEELENSNRDVSTEPEIVSVSSHDIDEDGHEEAKPGAVVGHSEVRSSTEPFLKQSHTTDTPETKDGVRLFLHTNQDGGSSTIRSDFLNQAQNFNSTNQILNANETNTINRELLELRTPPTTRGSNRRRNRYRQRFRESADHPPRRTNQMSRSKPPRYYDEYDASESIEISSRQRDNRYRSKERLIARDEDDYIDDDAARDRDYDERYLYRSRARKRGPQGRRVPIRNRNRHLDYEDDLEVHEKPDSLTKAQYGNSDGHRVNAYPARYREDTRLRLNSEQGVNKQRQQMYRNPAHAVAIETETTTRNSVGITSNSAEDLSPSVRPGEEYSTHNSNNGSHESKSPIKDGPSSFKKNEELVGKQGELKEEYPIDDDSSRESYDDNRSGWRDSGDDYQDYFVSRYHTGRTRTSDRNNMNRSVGISPKARRGSRRRNKSQSTTDAPGYREGTSDPIETSLGDLATSKYDIKTRITESPVKNYDSGGVTVTEEYDEHGSTEIIPQVDNTESPRTTDQKLQAQDVSTEGVLIFTDELPQSPSTEDAMGNDSPIAIDEGDYVDDNYEAEIYTSSENDQSTTRSPTIESKDSKRVDGKNKSENMYENGSFTTMERQSEETLNKTRENIRKNASDPNPPKRYDNRGSNTFFSSPSPPQSSTPTSTLITPDVGSLTKDITTTESLDYKTTNNIPTTRYSIYPSSSPTSSTTSRSRASTKFVKPTVSRKNYSHSTLTTTPNSVTIRHSSLVGPKPTKPPTSHNDFASKPLIRRLPLLSRTTTTTSEASVFEDEISANLAKQFAEEASKHVSAMKGSSLDQKVPGVIINTPITDTSHHSQSANLSENSSLTNSDNVKNNHRYEIPTNLHALQHTTNHSKEQILDNEVPKYSPRITETNEVPQNSYESNNGVLESKTQSTTSSSSSKERSKGVGENTKVSEFQTTTQRILKPSERRKLELTSVKSQLLKSNEGLKQLAGFNCLEKEMYRFYGDARDCRLFHYCSPGFTSRQVLDFRFVCEEGTIFDENSQSCLHDVPNPKCVKRNCTRNTCLFWVPEVLQNFRIRSKTTLITDGTYTDQIS